MSETPDLMLCPFCGGEAHFLAPPTQQAAFGKRYYRQVVGCSNDLCCAEVTSGMRKSADDARADAARRWNRRAERTCTLDLVDDEETMSLRRAHPEALWPCDCPSLLRCSACGRLYPQDHPRMRYCAGCGARIKEAAR